MLPVPPSTVTHLYGCQFPGTSPDHPGISPAGRERYQKRSGISPRPLCPRPPDGDIPGRRGHPGPRWGYPRPLGDIPGRVSGMSSTSGDIPGLWRGASPTGSGISPALRGMPRPRLGRWCRTRNPHHALKTDSRQHVNVVYVTPRDRPRALTARLWPPRTRSPRARGRGEDQRATQRGEARRQAGRVALRPRCAPLYGAPSSTEQTSRRGPDSARSEGCGRPPSRRACGTGRSVAEACASKEPRPGAVESWSRARRRQPARAHAGCREPPSPAAQERG